MQKFLPNTVPNFFDISYAEPTFHSSEKPQILSCSGLFTELFAKFFPKKTFRISSLSPCDNLTKNR